MIRSARESASWVRVLASYECGSALGSVMIALTVTFEPVRLPAICSATLPHTSVDATTEMESELPALDELHAAAATRTMPAARPAPVLPQRSTAVPSRY